MSDLERAYLRLRSAYLVGKGVRLTGAEVQAILDADDALMTAVEQIWRDRSKPTAG